MFAVFATMKIHFVATGPPDYTLSQPRRSPYEWTEWSFVMTSEWREALVKM